MLKNRQNYAQALDNTPHWTAAFELIVQGMSCIELLTSPLVLPSYSISKRVNNRPAHELHKDLQQSARAIVT